MPPCPFDLHKTNVPRRRIMCSITRVPSYAQSNLKTPNRVFRLSHGTISKNLVGANDMSSAGLVLIVLLLGRLLLGHFGPRLPCLRESYRDRLLPTLDLLARFTAFQGPLLLLMHRLLNFLGCLLAILSHRYSFLNRHTERSSSIFETKNKEICYMC